MTPCFEIQKLIIDACNETVLNSLVSGLMLANALSLNCGTVRSNSNPTTIVRFVVATSVNNL